jgi:hypothetical protein
MTELNNSNVIALGLEAGRRWGLSSKHGDAGDANAIVALVHASRTMSFTATIERKKEDTVETVDFDITDLAVEPRNSDGTVDTKTKAARTVAIASRLFGIEELTNANKQRIARAVKCALYLINSCSAMSDEDLFAAVTLRGDKLVVPNELVRSEPAEDASENDKAIYEAMKGRPLVLDGKDKASLAELSRRANPPKANRAAGENKDKGASFVASVDYVTAIVQQQISEETDEAEIGLNSDAREKLFRLAQYISAYFAADPMEQDEQEAVAA